MAARFCRQSLKSCLLLVCVALEGCSGVDFADPGAEKDPEVVKILSNDHLKAEILAGEEANSYQIRFSFPKSRSGTWFLRKVAKAEARAFVLPISSAQLASGFLDADVRAGGKYAYALADGLGSDSKETTPLEIEVPKDLKISEFKDSGPNSAKSEITGYRRLFLERSNSLSTLGRQFSIDVEEIHSNGGEIQTFPENKTGDLGQNGRTGGTLAVRAKRVVGTLRIILRGERGGQGLKGPLGPKGATGAQGRETHEREVMTYFCYPQLKYWLDREGQAHLNRHPGRGGRGETGGRGFQGYEGKLGGNAGDLELQISESDPSQIQILIQPGAGGLGGEGGDGGPGGDPGPGGAVPGNRSCMECCPSVPGDPGNSGPQGPKGPEGQKGSKGTVIFNGRTCDTSSEVAKCE